jgi:hypothetical protein
VLELLLVAASLAAAGEGGAVLRLDASSGAIELTGLDRDEIERLSTTPVERWPTLFAVYVAGARGADPPPLAGSYRLTGGGARFEPRFPLAPGVRYRAVFRPERSRPIEAEFSIPRPPSLPTRIEALYPSAARVPENLLKIYLYFSAPMSRGEAYRRIRLIELASGRAVEDPFLELDEELWDRQGRRLTIFFDPGRIKRGLRPREEAGPVLREGERYAIQIDRAWPDAAGNPLARSFEQEFAAGPPDERQPDPKEWKISPPRGGSRDPLVIAFPEPLDHALLLRVLAVLDAAGNAVPGEVGVESSDTRWRFVPAAAWRSGEHRLRVGSTLEDLAGNSIGRPFEIDRFHPIERRTEETSVDIPFSIR